MVLVQLSKLLAEEAGRQERRDEAGALKAGRASDGEEALILRRALGAVQEEVELLRQVCVEALVMDGGFRRAIHRRGKQPAPLVQLLDGRPCFRWPMLLP